ncbi:MAG: phage tail tape measure protein [Negativibacillus sp.]
MAETLTIEIPIEAVDRTSAGVQSATRNLTAFEKAWDRTQRRLDRLERAHNIDIELDDNASQGLSRVSDQAESLDGVSPSVDVSVNNGATETLSDVSDQAAALDGMSSDVEVGADDSATQVISSASDAAENFDGTSATAEIGADDNASQIVDAARDRVEEFSGASGSAQIGADDNASPVIDSVRDKAAAWDGSVWTATVSIVDAATAPLTAIVNAARNPLTQAGAALGVSVGLGDTVNTYKNFESMMSQVQAISGSTGAELDALTAKAQEMGSTTKFTATEAAQAFNYMAMAGWKSQDMINGIGGIMNLAAASGEDLGSTSDIVTDALTAFGLKAGDAGHFADVLAKASANANTNVGMLGESFKYVAPVAGAMNYSVEDTSLALGLMANASIKGSMAGTALKTSLANMASPTDSMAAAMDKYNISLTKSDGSMKSLGEVITNLRSSLGGLSETEQTAAASTIFGKEAMAGMLAIINASEEDYNKLSTAIYNADGAAQDMSDTMLDNLEGSMTLMQSAVEGVQNSFGQRLTPYIRGVVDNITEAMPAAEAALTSLMDYVDGKAAGLKRTVDSMVNSEEWQGADLFGKVDIAWDTLIAQPFTKWAGGKGKHLLSKGLGNLFSEAAKIMPGGEEAGLTSWLSAGILAKGATSLIGGAGNILKTLEPIGGAIKSIGSAASNASSIGNFVNELGSMIPMAGKVGLAAAGITAAVVAIGVAVDNYNQKRMNNSLAEHFGNIELSAKQAEEAASGILNAKYLVNVEFAMGEFKNADEMRKKAEEALQSNQALTWKSSIGIELTVDEQQQYKDNITTFVESKISELESRTFAAHISVQTFLGGTEEGETLASSIEEWARADNLELTNLSNDLKTAVENALQDGIIDVDEAQAVAALQDKINGITSKWKQAEAQAQLDWINQEYGSLSGKDLTSESFTSVVEALASQRETAAEETQALATEFYSYLNAAEASGRITKRQNEQYKDLASQAIRNQKANDLMTSLNFENNTLGGTYGDLISTNQGKTQKSMDNAVNYLKGYLNNNDYQSLYDQLNMLGADYAQQGGGWSFLQSADQNALESVWEAMKPDASSMRNLIDEYVNVGQEVPRQIMDKFNETMAIGAASGDTAAAWDVYAKSIADSGDKALIDAIGEMDANGQLGEEFSAAWKRATASVTDEPVELSGLKAEVDGVDIDKEAWVSSLNEKLGDLAETEDVTAEGATIKVKAGDCLWEIGNALGIDWQTIAEENGIESPYIIHAGDELKISMDNLTAEVDGDAATTAIDQAMSALTAEGAEFSVTADGVKVDLANVEVDSETAMAQIEAALGMETGTLSGAGIEVQSGATVTIPSDLVQVDTSGIEAAVEQSAASGSEDTTVEKQVNVTTTAGSTDTTPVEQAAQEALSGETSTTDTTMTTNVTVEAGSTDATPAATAAQTELDNTFSNTMQTNGSTDVTIEKASDNIAAVYSQVGSELQAAFNSPYSARASVNVTVDYHITNPTASLSTSSSGSTVSVSIAGHASGGEVGLHGAELSWLGEEGKEYVIPTVPGRRGRGIALWQQAGVDLGVLDRNGEIAAHANGGIVGPGGDELAGNTILPLTAQPQEESKSVWSVTGQELTGNSSEEESEGKKAISVNAAVQGQQGNNTFEINVDMSPVIKIEGGNMDEGKVFEVMKNRIREMADDLGDEIGERLSKIFANMPLIQEA